ncbi:MAG: TerB family tellurite resistance protein, partial [Nitratireductor sp.]|nr:TerB family tellurite resistance protein [Nitratireductor sp.]
AASRNRDMAFSLALIALSAKMARADGVVTHDERRAFGDIFSVEDGDRAHVERVFELAERDVAGFEAYARQIAEAFGEDRQMLEDVLDGLFHIAKADGVLHEAETAFLRRVAEIFGIDNTHFEAITARHLDLGEADPYVVLGVSRDMDFADIRRHYRKLIAESHPDRLIARGVPPEFIAIATARIAAINGAFGMIERSHRRARAETDV